MDRRKFLSAFFTTAVAAGLAVSGSSALARVGRPASPNSVAGVRRRRRRRHRRRVHRHMTLHALPYGCAHIRYRSGVKYYYCGSIWYRPAYQGTTVVYIVDDIEAGANTDLEFDY
jgi:hypothetical protein